MRITKSQLQSFVREELQGLSEDDWPKKVKKGRFTKYCKRKGFESGAGIGCSEVAMDSPSDSVRGMASFYMNTVKPGGKDASDVAEELTKESLQEYIDEVLGLSEVTAGAEKFADFEALAQAFREDRTDRKAAQEIVYYIEDIVSPEMENLGLVDTATESAKGNGLFDWSSRSPDPYKNASIDLYDDGYEVEVYPSSDEDERQETKAETLMDAINFIRGVLSPQGAVAPAPGEAPAQMELPLQESRKIKIRRKKK